MAVAVSSMPGVSAAPRLTSCRTLIAFLDEDDHALKNFALENIVSPWNPAPPQNLAMSAKPHLGTAPCFPVCDGTPLRHRVPKQACTIGGASLPPAYALPGC